MQTYIITYDLCTKFGDVNERYNDIIAELSKFAKAVMLAESSYLVLTSYDRGTVYSKIRRHMFYSDILFVADIKSGAHWSDSCLASKKDIMDVLCA